MTRRKYIGCIDVDTDDMANALRRLAEGIESHEIGITAASSTTEIADPEDLAEHGFSLRYHATHDYADVVDMIAYATDAYLRFDDQYVGPILQGDKTTTMRYGLRRDVEPGDQIALIDEDDDVFAYVDVEASLDVPVEQAVEMGIGPYDDHTVEFLVDRLRELYDESIDAESTVTAVLFSGVEPNDDYPTDQFL